MSTDLDTLTAKLDSLRVKIEEANANAKKRSTRAMVTMLVFVLIMAGYLTFSYTYIANQNAATYVNLAISPLKPKLLQGADALAKSLKDQAPEYVDKAGKFALDIPSKMSGYAKNFITDQIQLNSAKVENQLVGALDASLTSAEAQVRDKNLDLKDPASYDKASTLIATTFHDESSKAIHDFYNSYTERADVILAHLDDLARGEKLNKRDQIHRDLITIFLALLRRPDIGLAPVPGVDVPKEGVPVAPAPEK